MVRLMRWMMGLMITSVSTVFAIKTLPTNTDNSKNQTDDNEKNRYYDALYSNGTNTSDISSSSPRNLYEIGGSNNCTPPSIDDFPPDIMNQEQRRHGGMIFHVLLGIYACYALAAVCDTFFVPSLNLLSERLGLTSDVAGATFMAAGTSSPELFESIIGAFITQGDIGVGTIVGSAVFNILAVTSVCAIVTGMVVPLDWWPLTRDCAFYVLTVIALVVVIHDEKVYWYEATVLLIMFALYVVMMYFNSSLSTFFNSRFGSSSSSRQHTDIKSTVEDGHLSDPSSKQTDILRKTAISIIDVTLSLGNNEKHISTTSNELMANGNGKVLNGLRDGENSKEINVSCEEDEEWSLSSVPDGSIFQKVAYFITWPIHFAFYLTIPNCNKKRWRSYYPLTFIVSVIYIGVLSYFVTWMVTILGFTIGVPDTVMGITFLAIGTSVPEGYSSVIVCRKGLGNMAISNSVGSNVFDVLFCLGLPWLIKAIAFSNNTGYVQIKSHGLVYSAILLLVAVVILYTVIAVYHFKLNIKVGIICLILYATFLAFASLIELNIFGYVNPPICL